MKIERKLLSQCGLDDLKRIYPKNVRCNDENGNTDCNLSRIGTCPYFSKNHDDDTNCAYVDILQAKTMRDIKKIITIYGDIVVRLVPKK